ncbi:MAG: response regulator [Mesorhizobium sp.]|uniref:response regulator n=1 Tax=Mesorhizobium sp. TaxID=1871066 RepID=UPI000FE7E8F8|nr:response regulator [Mesorhizobium sp.]RWH78895.1 MAG: response regulator [Mesorhizobium sp.]RWH81433.1 MAG: response regulator [Mesorhizobium sp.]RWH90332.1 MAG: response regulator [Mesorhizobium sp.]RWH97785.1 MAG: response regulator [Mesorhizobium sp.]RWI00356.1 MAG: response regulator [Mesorhizobium sp.]
MKKPLVLVADDEPMIGFDLEMTLSEAGFTVALAFSSEEAQRWLDDNRPDVAVLDVRLKDGECIPLVEILIALGVPFVVHTGSLEEDLDKAFERGKFISKPADPETIVDIVRSLINPDAESRSVRSG